ncbi:MAG: nicotinate-nucleotide--dimethylbenzimidazole phosphoribosyltransferase [Pseudomonadales bacterium]|nr:nicotinate-nucleotide--dimethylbenzimidazole phosphoribosyltransferase [Pseudomonadales bacterium]
MAAWYKADAKPYDNAMQAEAEKYQLTLTKPPGALGQLESIATRFSAFQNTLKPALNKIDVVVMAGDHGVADEGVSAFPQAVTGEMVKNFATGGAAISVLCRAMGADLTVLNLGTVFELPEINGVEDLRIAAGTANFCQQAAMTQEQMHAALAAGQSVADKASTKGTQIFIGGEMGIANTTSAACVAARLLNKTPAELAGPGTGLDKTQIEHKAEVIERALAKHQTESAEDVLCAFGGFELVGLVGAYIRCAQLGIPVLIDGYITTAAALAAVAMNASIKPWLIASHQSAEPAHIMMLQALELQPLLDIQMRLGEGSGAAVVIPIIQSACTLQSQMASFAAAGVSEKID